VIEIADRLLHDLADADLQDRIVQKFLTLIEQLGPDERERLRASLEGAASPSATVRSAFELPAARQATLQEAIGRLLGDGVATNFELKPALVCGIELSVDGQKIAWSIEDYLRSLDACMHNLVTSQTRQHDRTK
jgi:F-type H+-transporting ATPase subunit b